MRFKGEVDKLEAVRKIASDIGYGNCIQYLQHAWANHLLTHGLDRKAAAFGAGMCKEEAKVYADGYTVLAEDMK